MTLPENVRDVALKITDSIPKGVMWIVVLLVAHDAVLYWSLSNVASERIAAVVRLVEVCFAR